MTIKLAVTFAFSCLLILQSAIAAGQTTITPSGSAQQSGEAEAKKFNDLEKKADDLKQKVDKLPSEQAEKGRLFKTRRRGHLHFGANQV